MQRRVRWLLQLIDTGSELVFEPLPDDDPTRRQPDITLARRLLGWRPRVQLDEGLGRTIAYFAEHLRQSEALSAEPYRRVGAAE